MHIYIVNVSDLFRVLPGNQRKATLGTNAFQINVLIYMKNCCYAQTSQILMYLNQHRM